MVGERAWVSYTGGEGRPRPMRGEVVARFKRRGCWMHVVEVYVDPEVGWLYEIVSRVGMWRTRGEMP